MKRLVQHFFQIPSLRIVRGACGQGRWQDEFSLSRRQVNCGKCKRTRLYRRLPNAPDQARAGSPSPEAGCSASWRDDLVPKGAVHDLISDMPLGYRTEGEHEKLERFADKVCAAVIRMPNNMLTVSGERQKGQTA